MRIVIPVSVLISLTFAFSATAQVGDFNQDGNYDCHDVEILESSMRGEVELDFDGDLGTWFGIAESALGYEIPDGDANLDGMVNARDANLASINYIWRTDPNPRPLGWCQADLNGDGFSDAADKGVWQTYWQQGRMLERPNATVTHHDVNPIAAWRDGEAVIASTDDYEIVAIPQSAPNKFLSTVLAFRQKDPGNRFTLMEGVQLSGDVHHTMSSLIFFGPATRFDLEHSHEGALYHPEWAKYDSHLLWDPLTFGVYGLREDNDSSDPTNTTPTWPALPTTAEAVMGLGDLGMDLTNVASINWDDNETYFEFAQVITPAQMPDTNEPGEVFLRVNLHSGDADSRPVPEVGFIGVDEPFQIPFFSRPCDVDTDGDCDLSDWDLMLQSLGKTNPHHDISQDGLPINNVDLRLWRFYAETVDVTAPLRGDTNFDGRIDQQDLNALALNWGKQGDYGWVGGDFDGNGVADAADLNQIARRWQHGTDAAPAPVPEPGVSWLYLVLIGLTGGILRRVGFVDHRIETRY